MLQRLSPDTITLHLTFSDQPTLRDPLPVQGLFDAPPTNEGFDTRDCQRGESVKRMSLRP
ncbi:hypothetical protein RISK_001631 [Rhodopirellula islandica]|uniref:Uncharacterized protein n=1 Tax=Rhodopirellula islandica TaxID=595434 RepID=A0A0J1BIQ9_RHOIS|nr:hypothetical protein RISK_001631 [Rhodopirellula islandica]